MVDFTLAIAMLNRLVNHPDILPHVAPGYANLDMSQFFNRSGNIMLGNENGAMLFLEISPGVYDCHVLFTKALRGKEALTVMRWMVSDIFTDHGAKVIVTQSPNANLPVRRMVRAMGGAPTGHSTDSLGRPCTNYILERDTWAHLLAGLSGGWAPILGHSNKPVQPRTRPRLH